MTNEKKESFVDQKVNEIKKGIREQEVIAIARNSANETYIVSNGNINHSLPELYMMAKLLDDALKALQNQIKIIQQ